MKRIILPFLGMLFVSGIAQAEPAWQGIERQCAAKLEKNLWQDIARCTVIHAAPSTLAKSLEECLDRVGRSNQPMAHDRTADVMTCLQIR
jgi:hypothetical protein